MLLPAYTDLTGLGGIAIGIATSVVLLPGVRRLPRTQLSWLFAGIIVVALAPLGTLPIAACVRGVTGDLSLTTLVVLSSALWRLLSGQPKENNRERLALRGVIAVAALAMYPMVLGVGMFDPYRLGYGSPWFFAALAVAMLLAWWRRHLTIATCLALGTLGWALRGYESTNVWDYLLDPLISFYALGSLAVAAIQAGVRAFRASRPAADASG